MLMAATDAHRQTKENCDSLNLSNCHKGLLEEIEHEVNLSVAECSYFTTVFAKDKDHFEDGLTSEDVDCTARYLTETLGYKVTVGYTAETERPSNYWKLLISW